MHPDASGVGLSALILLAVTAGLAVLAAVSSGQAWPPVVVAFLGTVPTLYLAWLAVPGVARPTGSESVGMPVRSRRPGDWTPKELGVHQVTGGSRLSTYVRRPHDELLRAVLDPAVSASRLVVIRGGSSTGKTRAAYEAVTDVLADWRLDYPLDASALANRLKDGIQARTVLWLGELRQYADADGGPAVLSRLADLLQGNSCLAITTMWPEHWDTYTTAASARSGSADPAGAVGLLLEGMQELTDRAPAGIDPARGGVIDVPDRFTAADLTAAACTGDPALAKAAEAAAREGDDGQVTQYLAGVPDLLDRYEGLGGDPYGQAVLSAAMDAARLGHSASLPAVLVQEAAVGYLTDLQRTRDITAWREAALAWAAEELKGAVRALRPVPPPSGTGVNGYQVADYLVQHAYRTRRDQLGPTSLWDALAAHTTSVSDLNRLGHAAESRGLYRHASVLWTKAANLGSADATVSLILLLRNASSGETGKAARWFADRGSLDDPSKAAWLVDVLRDAGQRDAAMALAVRAAHHVNPDQLGAVAVLRVLQDTGQHKAAMALAVRAAHHVNPDDPHAVGRLLGALRGAGGHESATALAARAAHHSSLDDPYATAQLVDVLRDAGQRDAAFALAVRAAHHVNPGKLGAVEVLRALLRAGAADAAEAFTARAVQAADHVSLQDPLEVVSLLDVLPVAGQRDAASALAARAAHHVNLDDSQKVSWLLDVLLDAGKDDAATALATRAARAIDHVDLDNPRAVSGLRSALQRAGQRDAATALATRAAHHISIDNSEAVARLLAVLRHAGESDAAEALTARAVQAADHVSLQDPYAVVPLLGALRDAGQHEAATVLAVRAARAIDHVNIYIWDPDVVARLVGALREAGEHEAATALATRAANAGKLNLDLEPVPHTAHSHKAGRESDSTPSQPWKWQEPPDHP